VEDQKNKLKLDVGISFKVTDISTL